MAGCDIPTYRLNLSRGWFRENWLPDMLLTWVKLQFVERFHNIVGLGEEQKMAISLVHTISLILDHIIHWNTKKHASILKIGCSRGELKNKRYKKSVFCTTLYNNDDKPSRGSMFQLNMGSRWSNICRIIILVMNLLKLVGWSAVGTIQGSRIL